ncbi:hypothetical protein PPIS_b0350 [Pseudoalteromonas piscicida]|uniref:Uncharacterized protein n=1 Tax=Pseudoalteromonas piscicida TaxID=43662 RepID=A0ABN5CLI0_PSEO7|nr:hypothetical protein PPIS_b0350 [Pseudoalteromonas piscicida]
MSRFGLYLTDSYERKADLRLVYFWLSIFTLILHLGKRAIWPFLSSSNFSFKG